MDQKEQQPDDVTPDLALILGRVLSVGNRARILMEAISPASAIAQQKSEERHGTIRKSIVTSIAASSAVSEAYIEQLMQQFGHKAPDDGTKLESELRASAVVLIHSQADLVVTDLLRLVVRSDTARWAPIIARSDVKTFTLSEVLDGDRELLWQSARERYLRKLEHKSLSSRNDLLLANTLGATIYEPFAPFVKAMHRQELTRFDKLRHAIVHSGDKYPLTEDSLADCGNVLTHILFLALRTASYFKLDVIVLLSQAVVRSDPFN